LDSWFISGTGVGQPLGILNAPCLVSVAKDGSQVAATITPTNLAGMVSRLAPGSWARATWIVSPSALAALFTIKVVITTVAGAENVGGFGPNWFTSNPDGTFMLLGRPLIVSDRCAALGTKGDVLLVDLKSYLVGLRYPLLAGRYEVSSMPVIVSRGAGTWGPRMRLWRPGEIVKIKLKAAS